MNTVSFGHNYNLSDYRRSELDNGVKEARKMLNTLDKNGWDYERFNKKLTEIENEDVFVKEAENKYQDRVNGIKSHIRILERDLEELEMDKEGSIAKILGDKLSDALQYLTQSIRTQQIYEQEGGIHPNR